ncbi:MULTISPECIES: glycosyltransferase [unclassified Coleofasciculus]|uniref:glycosyltransferase n=1 Tax=unclassified Coleofasciculus TaxID=2692782 RepID=UPI00187DEB02|nr:MULTISPECIES: glycosyltransferase [unclassified Coleofasciculus]MBE9126812.1 glycosyltransferase [Coleofasciculus sp. LEGE 07081]MBE9150183.1 glycosyltransferase [Coleofasciculus sp. LEGE 07092]
MQQSLVSVVIPTHNRLQFLKQAVKSVKGQTFKNWELIVVDDMSSDGTWEWLTELKDERIRAFRLSEQSFREGACNRGLVESAGKFIMFFDDDDLLRPDALATLVKPLNNDPQLVATIGARWKFKEGVYALKIEHPIIPCKRIIWSELLAGWSAVSGQNLYRTASVKEIGGFSRDFYRVEDRDLWLRLARLGPVMLLPAITVEYRVHHDQWRPKNIVELREKVFQAFIASLPAEEQPRGKRIRKSAHCSEKAEDEYRKGNYKEALNCYIKACKAAPELAVSPITGPPLSRGVAKSLVRSLLPK